MEKRILEEEKHHGVCTHISNSSGSLIKIDSISIDLGNGNEKNEIGNCKHFTIRGYVAEIRKKDRKICWPFGIDDKHDNPEEYICTLPPLQATKFRWWHCQNCMREIDPQGTANEIETVPKCSNNGVKSNSSWPHMSSQNEAAILPSDFQQALRLDSLGGREAEVAHTTGIGHENSSKDDVNQEFPRPSSDPTKFNQWLKLERHTGDKVALESQCNGFVETCKTNCGINEATADGLSSTYLSCQMGKDISVDDQNKEPMTVCGISGVVGVVNEAVFAANGHASEHPSLEFDTHDCTSSESDDILGANNLLDQHHEDSSSFHSQKPQKVRLLAELLVANGNENADYIRAAPSSGSTGVDSLSVSQGQVAIQGNIGRGCKGQTRKRKTPHDGDLKSPEMSSPNSENKKSRMFMEDVENTAIALAASKSNKDASAGISSQAGEKHHWNKHGVDRNPLLNKKMKKTWEYERCSSLLPLQEVVPGDNEKKIQDAYKSNTGDTAPTHPFSTGRVIEPLLRSFFPAQLTVKKSSLCKKKNKMPQAENLQAFLNPWNNDLLREKSITRQNVETMRTGHEVVPFQSLQDASTGKGPYFSYENYLAAQENNRNCSAHIEGRSDFLLPRREGVFREDEVTRKNVGSKYVGESSVPYKSAADAFIDKEVRWDRSFMTGPGKTSLVREKRNRPPRVEAGNLSALQKMDVFGKSNGEKEIRVKEHSEFIKKQGGQRADADKVFEQGAIDDIPMEIVELLAKNQYERRLHDAEKVPSLETTYKARNGERIDANNVCADGEVKLLHNKNPHLRNSRSSNARKNLFTIGETVEHKAAGIWPSLIQNHMSYGCNIPQNYEAQASSLDMLPQRPVTQQKGKMNGDHDLKFLNLNVAGYEKQNKNFGSETINETRREYPYACKKGAEFYPQLLGSVDMYSNETIPAMHLLSLMDPGMRSTTPFSVDAKTKFLKRSSFPLDHQSKELSELENGMYNTSHASRHVSSVDYRKNPLSEKPSECYSAVPAFGALTSSLQNDTSIRRATDSLAQVTPKSQEKGKAKISYSPTRSRVPKSQKSASINVGFGTNCEFSHVQSTEKRFRGASDSIVYPSQCRAMTNSMKHIELESQSSHGLVWPVKRSLEKEICSVNRNPADFSMPGAGNMYMIGAEDLKFKKRVCSGDTSTLFSENRQKKQRLTKLTAAKRTGTK